MPDITWFKLDINIFDDEKIQIIESLPERDTILMIWIKLIALATKGNRGGYVSLSDNLPYTDEMLASVLRRPINTVRMALKTFTEMAMINIDSNGIFLTNWSKHQSADSLNYYREMNKKRQQKYRENHKILVQHKASNVTVTLRNAIDKDKDKEYRNNVTSNVTRPGKKLIYVY